MGCCSPHACLDQARAGELGHLEFLQVLCHDEISPARRPRHPPHPVRTNLTLEGFDFTAAPKLPAAQIRDLAKHPGVAAQERHTVAADQETQANWS